MRDERLTLLGQSAEDLTAISALLQDATLRGADLAWDKRSRRLVLLVNRYRWESSIRSRVRAALRMETVAAVQRQNWPPAPDAVLNLLSLTQDGEWLVLTFAAGAALRARVEVIEVVLEDIAAPWGTGREPQHPA
ncbi:MAG: DUF2948 family protein [Polymorphobacter sp.]